LTAQYKVSTLPGGLRVATAEMPHMTSVSVGIWVGVGSRHEPEPVNGICHFIEHLLFKGTKRRTAREISEAVEGIGGTLNAFTSEELTCFHARASADRFKELLDVLTDMLLHSRFDPVEIRKERSVIKEEIAMYLDEPQHQVQELLNATMWPDQPLGRPITGTPESLDRISRPTLLAYLRQNYSRTNTVIVAAGNIHHETVKSGCARIVRRLQLASPAQHSPVVISQSQPAIALHTKQTEQAQIALGIRTCSRHDDRRYALRLLNVILGENMSSRLFQSIREELGLAYSIYSTPSHYHDTGDFAVYAGLDEANIVKALRLVMRELKTLGEKPVSKAELQRAREYVIGHINLAQENTESQMNWAGEQLLGYGEIFTAAKVKDRLSRVTTAEVKAAARAFVQPHNLSLAVVSPMKDTPTNVARLRKLLN